MGSPGLNEVLELVAGYLKPIVQEAVREELRAAEPAPMAAPTAKESYTPAEIERVFGIKKGTLSALRCHGKGPAYFKDGRKILYTKKDIEAYLKKGRVKTYDQQN